MQDEVVQFQKKCDELNERFEALRQKHEKKIHTLKTVCIVCIVLIVLGVPLVALGGLGILLIIISRFVYKKTKEKIEHLGWQYNLAINQLQYEYKEDVYLPIAEQGFLYGDYSEKNLEVPFKTSGLCQPERIQFYGGMSGVHNGISFKETMIQLYKNKRDGTRIDYYEGSILQFDNPIPCAAPVYVESMCSAFTTSGGIQRIKNIDNPQFSENASVYGDDALSVFRILTPVYMEKLLPYIESRLIDTIIFGQEHIMVFVKRKGIHYDFYGYPPFTVEQCAEEISNKNGQLKQLIEEIYNIVVESMR